MFKICFYTLPDDTTLNSTLDSFGNDTEKIQNLIKSKLKKIFKWLDVKKLCLNLSKPKLCICKAQNYCRKCCIHIVCYFSNWYYHLLPYYNSIVTTPVYWNSHFPMHTIKLVYCNNHPHKYKLIYTKKYFVR